MIVDVRRKGDDKCLVIDLATGKWIKNCIYADDEEGIYKITLEMKDTFDWVAVMKGKIKIIAAKDMNEEYFKKGSIDKSGDVGARLSVIREEV